MQRPQKTYQFYPKKSRNEFWDFGPIFDLIWGGAGRAEIELNGAKNLGKHFLDYLEKVLFSDFQKDQIFPFFGPKNFLEGQKLQKIANFS